MSCELICTGWYSSDEARTYQTFGDDSIRNNSFRPLWWHSVDAFIKPQHVLVVDSASPVKPEDYLYTSTKFSNIELLKNPGHSQSCETHYCGYILFHEHTKYTPHHQYRLSYSFCDMPFLNCG